jgi:hypothetical protein
MDLPVTITVPAERVADLLCSGFEGGTRYWAKIVGKRRPKTIVVLGDHWADTAANPYPHIHYPLSEGGSITVLDTDTGKKHILDLSAIQRGLAAMQEKAPRAFGDLLAENDDAFTGDVFIQCCLFGEVIYG